MLRKVVLILSLLILSPILSGCEEFAEKRVREIFDIHHNIPLTERNIHAAIIKKIPIGTSEKDIYKILTELKVGSDKSSSFYPAYEKGEIVCRFEYNPSTLGFVKKHYVIIFLLDGKYSLSDVKVYEWLTGL